MISLRLCAQLVCHVHTANVRVSMHPCSYKQWQFDVILLNANYLNSAELATKENITLTYLERTLKFTQAKQTH